MQQLSYLLQRTFPYSTFIKSYTSNVKALFRSRKVQVSRRKGRWSTINLTTMIEVTRKPNSLNRLWGQWWSSLWTRCHWKLLEKNLFMGFLACQRIVDLKSALTLEGKKSKFWHLVWANLTFYKFSLFFFSYPFCTFSYSITVCVSIKFYRLASKTTLENVRVVKKDLDVCEVFGNWWESDELAGHGLSRLEKLWLICHSKSFVVSLSLSLSIPTGHTSQWKKKGFHAKHNKGGGGGHRGRVR